MTAPEPVSEVILEILHCGILEARAAAWAGDVELCATLTDHIHNLPDLLANFSEERLEHYLEIERPSFISAVGGDTRSYDEYWTALRKHCLRRQSTIAKDG